MMSSREDEGGKKKKKKERKTREVEKIVAECILFPPHLLQQNAGPVVIAVGH